MKYIIKPKALRHISKIISEVDTKEELTSYFREKGANNELINNYTKSTKSELVYEILSSLNEPKDKEKHNLLFDVIEGLAHPLMYKGDERVAERFVKKINSFLKYDGLAFSRKEKKIDRAPRITRVRKIPKIEIFRLRLDKLRITVNNKYFIKKLSFNTDLEKLFEYVIKNPRKRIRNEDLPDYLNKGWDFHKPVGNWNFKGKIRDLFFDVSRDCIRLNNPIYNYDIALSSFINEEEVIEELIKL